MAFVPAVDEFPQERPERPALARGQVGTGGFLMLGDTLAELAQHSLPARRQRERVAPGVAVCVGSHDKPGFNRAGNSGADRGALQPDQARQPRLADAWMLRQHGDDTDYGRRHLPMANFPSEGQHHPVIGDVQVQSQHWVALRTELRFDHGGRWRGIRVGAWMRTGR